MKPGFYLLISPWPRSPVPHGAQPAKFVFWGQRQNYSKTRYRGQREWELGPRFRDSGLSQPASGWVPASHLPEVCLAEFDGDYLPTGREQLSLWS